MDLQPHLDARIHELIDEAASLNVQSDDLTAAAKNLEALSKVRTLLPDPEPVPTPVPVTKWEQVKAGLTSVWDNETTRVLIKAGGAFAGVGLVVWSTVRRDHQLERDALSQANQRNS